MDVIEFTKILDNVRNSEDLKPHDGVTYCNIAINRILKLYGIAPLIYKNNQQPLMANAMCDYLRDSGTTWLKIDGDAACARANRGLLVLACQRGEAHGHIAAVYPLPASYSPSWAKYVPMLNNIGRKNAIMRCSQCFRTEPDYYAYRKV